ncbi:MAG: hypothetical protein DSY38_03455 [Fusobacteria bacterium]|nr:MAG: hypothetical protein DSY38_03455 [Fusobacteriota bacterium]
MKRLYTYVLLPILALLFSIPGNAQVDVYKGLYNKSDDGSVYMSVAYNVYTTDKEDLDAYTVDAGINILNIYYNDGSNKKYSLHDVAGKTLKEIFGGDNQENQIVDISQLRDDYREWFTLEDGSKTLVSCNVIARQSDAVKVDPVDVTTDLHSANDQGTQYMTTAYFVKGFATLDDLENIKVSSDASWLNVYVKNTDGDSEDPYKRIDIEGVAGKSLKTILEEEGISINQLYWTYKEWFKKDGSPKLVNLNIKAMIMGETVKVEVTPGLYASGQHDKYEMTGYKVFPSATDADLENIVIEADKADFVSVYYNKVIGPGSKRIDVPVTSDTNLKEVLASAGSGVDKLNQNYREWFYMKDGDGNFSPTLLNINAKAVKTIGAVDMVTVTDNLYSTGDYDYINKAFFVNTNATEEELDKYTLTGDAGTNIYYIDENGEEQNLNVQGTNGKTLRELLEENNITVQALRRDYLEWFTDADGKKVLVNLNIKQKTIDVNAEKVIITKGLKSTSGSKTFENTAYYVKTSASMDDLSTIILDDDIEYLNVYIIDNDGNDTRLDLFDVAGKSLKEALEGGNVTLDELEHSYVEWFKDANDAPTLVKLNIKSVKSYSLSISDNIIDEKLVSLYPNPVVSRLNVSIESSKSFEYSVYSVDGSLAIYGQSKGDKAVIDVSSLSKGVYFIKLKDGKKYFTSKFVK